MLNFPYHKLRLHLLVPYHEQLPADLCLEMDLDLNSDRLVRPDDPGVWRDVVEGVEGGAGANFVGDVLDHVGVCNLEVKDERARVVDIVGHDEVEVGIGGGHCEEGALGRKGVESAYKFKTKFSKL